MVVCSYAVWQYREKGIAESSGRNLLKNDVDGIVVGKQVFGATVVIGSINVLLGVEKSWRRPLSLGCRSQTEDEMKENGGFRLYAPPPKVM